MASLLKLAGLALVATVLASGNAGAEQQADLNDALQKLRDVGPNGKGNVPAAAAWQRIAAADASRLTTILGGMRGAGPIAENWFRTAIDTIAERELAATGKLPQAELEQFVRNEENPPRARRIAFEWLAKVDPTAADRLIPGMVEDPSLELRYDAIARQIDAAARLEGSAAADKYQQALENARDLGQVKQCVAALDKLGRKIDVAGQLGFVTDWKIVGPFDNTDGVGFDTAYAPEGETDFTANYDGKNGPIKWQDHTTEAAYGIVDLTKALDKHKGAVAYAAAAVTVAEPTEVELRLGCINANKVWVNGKLVQANNVYHAGMEVDQYIGQARLEAGENQILVKVCQNEQTESWAQRWQFQLRVTDSLGGAIARQQSAE